MGVPSIVFFEVKNACLSLSFPRIGESGSEPITERRIAMRIVVKQPARVDFERTDDLGNRSSEREWTITLLDGLDEKDLTRAREFTKCKQAIGQIVYCPSGIFEGKAFSSNVDIWARIPTDYFETLAGGLLVKRTPSVLAIHFDGGPRCMPDQNYVWDIGERPVGAVTGVKSWYPSIETALS